MEQSQNFADSILNAVFSNAKKAENSDAVFNLLEACKLNWQVEKIPLSLPTGEKTGFFGIVRSDTKETFSTCKDSYVPFQNSELAELLIRLSEKTGYELKRGGMFNGGGKVYIQLRSPNKITGIGSNNDQVNGYLTGINSHDGTASLKWGETNITISCRNTFHYAAKELKNNVRHTASMHQKVEQALLNIKEIVQAEKSLFDEFIKLSNTPANQTAVARIVKDITDVDITVSRSQAKDQYSTYSLNRSMELLKSIAQETEQKGFTYWGLLSGVTHYTTHILSVPNRPNAREESIYIGSANKINNYAFATLSGLRSN